MLWTINSYIEHFDAERNGRALDSNFITFVQKSTKEAHDRFGSPVSFRDNQEQLSELSASAMAVHGNFIWYS